LGGEDDSQNDAKQGDFEKAFKGQSKGRLKKNGLLIILPLLSGERETKDDGKAVGGASSQRRKRKNQKPHHDRIDEKKQIQHIERQ